MNSRRLRNIIKRIKKLPRGSDFFRYVKNKAKSAHLKLTKKLEVAYPSTIMIEVTNHCNLHCITCAREYHYGDSMDKGFIELDLLKSIVNQAYPYIDSIGLTGLGEPLLYKQLPEALEYIKAKSDGIFTSISTNANLKNTVEIIENVGHNINTLQISIDGIDDIYESVRKNSDYQLFIDNVVKILEISTRLDFDVIFNFVVVKENFHQMSDILRLGKKLGIKHINYTLFNLASVTDIKLEYYKIFHSDEFLTKLFQTKELAKTTNGMEITYWDYKSEQGFKKCGFPWNHFYITWDGFLVPCCAKPFPKEKYFGNLNSTPFIDCLNSVSFQKFRQLWFDNKTPSFCRKCHFIDLKAVNL